MGIRGRAAGRGHPAVALRGARTRPGEAPPLRRSRTCRAATGSRCGISRSRCWIGCACCSAVDVALGVDAHGERRIELRENGALVAAAVVLEREDMEGKRVASGGELLDSAALVA